ncbi:unnamed protein product, partial [Polarella glacialis]
MSQAFFETTAAWIIRFESFVPDCDVRPLRILSFGMPIRQVLITGTEWASPEFAAQLLNGIEMPRFLRWTFASPGRDSAMRQLRQPSFVKAASSDGALRSSELCGFSPSFRYPFVIPSCNQN